jgi:hypothetical protein
MNCLTNYIGMPSCPGGETPPSGISLNVLEIINKKLIASIADDDQVTLANCLSDIESRAIMRLSDDVRAEFYKKQRLRNITAQYNLKRDQLSTTATAPDAYVSKGIYISNVYENIQGFYEPLKNIHIQNVSFYADADDAGETVDLKIVDLDTSAVIYTKSVTLVTGWNSWDIELNCASSYYSNPNRIFIYINTTALSTYDKTLLQPITDASFDGLTIYGAKTTATSSITYSSLELGDNTFGMQVIASVKCSYDAVICQNRELFKRALLYAMGIEAMRELLSSDRINGYTTIGRQEAKDNITAWTTDYTTALFNAVDGLNVDGGNCTECHNTLMVKTAKGFY